MKELVVISGKGGTGKTSVVAAFAALADQPVLADCDVDAADLHLVTGPKVVEQHRFIGGKRASVIPERCTACGRCDVVCRFDAVRFDGPANDTVERTYRIDGIACEGCGVCVRYCPAEAIAFEPVQSGEWFISQTRFGPMVHARLGIAEGNSGKLVSIVRDRARQMARQEGRDLVLVDGAPGIGCAVIASITGADLVLLVTEPTVSGLHDFKRVRELTRYFGIRTLVCVNRWDLNEGVTHEIETEARRSHAEVVERVTYDPAVTAAQIAGMSVVEYGDGPAAGDLRTLWKRVSADLSEEAGDSAPVAGNHRASED